MRIKSALGFVLIIGIVNFFADLTYGGARWFVGPFLGSLGASAAIVGFVGGFGELIGYALRSVSGYFADKLGSTGSSLLLVMRSICLRFRHWRWPGSGRSQPRWYLPNARAEAFENQPWKPCSRMPVARSAPAGLLD